MIGHPRYRILGILDAGGIGVVYKAVHRLMERVVALKILNHSLTARPGFAERFRREVKAAARLAHPNIVVAYDADEAGAPSEPRSRQAEAQTLGVAQDPIGLASAEMLVRKKHEVRDRVVGWLRENCLRPVGDSVTAYVTSHVDKDLDGSEAFQVLLGSGLTKSSKAALLAGRAGELQVFELSPALGREVPPGCCRVQNYSTGDDRRRAVPRILLADLDVQEADHLFPERPVIGSVGYGQLEGLSPDVPGYSLSKLALNGLTIMLAEAPRADRIAVNSMSPGWVRMAMGGPDAPRTTARSPPARRKKWASPTTPMLVFSRLAKTGGHSP